MPARPVRVSPHQNFFGSSASLRTPFAMCRLTMPVGTTKFRMLTGLYQISWLPLPGQT